MYDKNVFNKKDLKIGYIIKDSNEEYGLILNFQGTKFISYEDGITPFECIDDNLIWVNTKDHLAINYVYELNDFIPLHDLSNLKTLDKAKKLICIWSRK